MKRNRTVRRRATVLIMVVTLLALLFVIVSGYLTLARFDRQTLIIAQQGNTADEIVDGVNNLVLSLVREQWLDSEGELFTGEPAAPPANYEYSTYEDIGGYRKSHWLAASEPVLDPTQPGGYWLLNAYRWAAISSLDPAAPIQTSIQRLMFDATQDNAFVVDLVNPLVDDLRPNVRRGFMDADGDGIPDAGLMASASATELANNVAGRSVRLRGTGLTPNAIPPNGDPTSTEDDFWRRYDDLARYEVAVRVVPHGGMVSLGLPNRTTSDQWNHAFAQRMFSWLGANKQGVGSPPTSQFMGELYAEAAAVEPALRRRGGLLPSYRPQGEDARVPDLLRRLEEDNWGIFAPRVNGEVLWQRFNLATIGTGPNIDEWILWQDRAFLNATRLKQDPGDMTLLGNYDCRHLITTVSYSDELCRKQERDPDPNAPGLPGLGVYHGRTKFYLGDVEKCFNANGTFNQAAANPIIWRLAGVFYDMLGGHAGWANEPSNVTESVTRDEQALMLAVNTVAFAAPRVPSGPNQGFIDVVAYAGGTPPKTYVGYAPQPFITQVIAYDSEDDPNATDEDIAVAIELYNPNDWKDLAGADEHALCLPQFGVSIDDGQRVSLGSLTPPGELLTHLEGRRFMSFAVHEGSNPFFRVNSGQFGRFNGSIEDYPTPIDSTGGITVKLWRQDASGANWYLVDMLEVDDSALNKNTDWYADTWRDTNTEPYWGIDAQGRAARWRMGLSFRSSSPSYSLMCNSWPEDGANPGGRLAEFGLFGPDEGPAAPRFGSTVPLYTMNADTQAMWGTTVWNIHGAPRPRSFPTVGFMLFLPRFSHLRTAASNVPVTEVVGNAWDTQSTSQNFNLTDYPADFGHMPIFDNKQSDDPSGSYFADNEAGRTPWGLLVFDYFTTLNPDGLDGVPNTADDLDPYRVPGRINVNAAPWYVLAGLPVVGPDVPNGDIVRIHPSASPAFWSTQSGILAGADAHDVPRSLLYRTDTYPDVWLRLSNDGWWRLGMDLALSVAEYRDRIPYIDPTQASPSFPYRWSYLRNDAPFSPGPPRYRDEMRYGESGGEAIRRGRWLPLPTNPRKFGFLTLGELANVKGFDSATYDPASGVGDGSGVGFLDPLAAPGSGDPVAGDFVRAVSLLALLDTHFLATRSNTFTAYVTVRDRQNAQQSVRSQITVDRSNLLPRLVLDVNGDPLFEDPDGPGGPEPLRAVVITKDGLPEVVAERRVGYHNARFDD